MMEIKREKNNIWKKKITVNLEFYIKRKHPSKTKMKSTIFIQTKPAADLYPKKFYMKFFAPKENYPIEKHKIKRKMEKQ